MPSAICSTKTKKNALLGVTMLMILGVVLYVSIWFGDSNNAPAPATPFPTTSPSVSPTVPTPAPM